MPKTNKTANSSKKAEVEQVAKKQRMKLGMAHLMVFVLLVLLVAGGIVGYSKYNDLKKENTKLSNPQEAAKTQVSDAVAKIGRLVDLPSGETPTLATVTDPTKLKDQAFFANAKVGDQVLIYTQVKKAILYRPSTNKIIEIAPVNIGNNNAAQQPSQ